MKIKLDKNMPGQSDIQRFAPGTHHGILLVRMHRPGRLALTLRVCTLFQSEDVSNWQGCFVAASDRKLRIRQPEGKD